MSEAKKSIARSEYTEKLLDRISGLNGKAGNPRIKAVVRRVVSDLFRAIEDLDVQPDEFWAAVSYLGTSGMSREVALLSPGLGFDHFLDLRLDDADRRAGIKGGTPRTIEGPLYVAGAPLEKGEVRLDDATEQGETLFVEGTVKDVNGQPIASAVVEVWHADTKGNYSTFDPSQSPFNLRRSIQTDDGGRYRFRTIMPSGYGCPPQGPTQKLLDGLGRHGKRPAHIHFFVHASGHRHLTTQINIAGDPLVNDDFAFATRAGLIPEVVRHTAKQEIEARKAGGPFAEIHFDFVLQKPAAGVADSLVSRERVSAAE